VGAGGASRRRALELGSYLISINHLRSLLRFEGSRGGLDSMLNDAHKPLTPQEVYDGEYWRRCALMTRDEAMASLDAALKARLLRIASGYDRLAGYAEAIERAVRED
jgi:hypothetical protein